MKKILVLCTGNSCRSQIAEGYLRSFLGDAAQVYSAGIETHGVNPRAIEIMQEDGIDISEHTSNHVDEYAEMKFDLILSVCDHARDQCPYIPGDAIRVHHSFSDPAKVSGDEESVRTAFRSVRNEIKAYCAELSKQVSS
jgi:arsenate reductase